MIAKFIVYSTFNITVGREGKKPEFIGLPIFLTGQMAYKPIKDVQVMDGQDYIFPLLWQVFWDSLLYDTAEPVLVDFFNAFGAIYIGKKLKEANEN